MKTAEAKALTIKIMAVILEEVSGYTKSEAINLAPDNEGHPVYERTLALLVRNVPKQEPVKCHHDFKYMEDYKIYVCLSCGYESKKGNINRVNKLNMMRATVIRRLKSNGFTYALIARLYRISETNVRDVVSNKIWYEIKTT